MGSLTSYGQSTIQDRISGGEGRVGVVTGFVVVVSDVEAGEFAVLHPEGAARRVNVLTVQSLKQVDKLDGREVATGMRFILLATDRLSLYSFILQNICWPYHH